MCFFRLERGWKGHRGFVSPELIKEYLAPADKSNKTLLYVSSAYGQCHEELLGACWTGVEGAGCFVKGCRSIVFVLDNCGDG